MVTSIHFQSLQLSLRPGTLYPERYFLIKKIYSVAENPLRLEHLALDPWCFQKKILIKWGKCRTLVHRNLNLLVGRWEGGALTSCDDWWLSPRGRERFLLFPARIQPIKSHGLLVHGAAPAPPLQAPAASSCLWSMWLQLTSWLQIPNYKSLLALNKPVFSGETSGSLFVSGQQPLST